MSVEQLSKLVGTTLDGKYAIIRQLGAGGMGVVFQANHAFMGKDVAIKMLSADLANDQTAFKRFQAEARAAASLNHINIIRVHDLDMSSAGYPFIVMDYLEGRSLDNVLKAQRTMKWERALKIFVKVCEALQHAHSRKVIHRDLKPSNIMLVHDDDGDEYPVVVDFGLAKLYDQAAEARGMKLTRTGQVFGTALYMSPEQCNAEQLDGRSDMYSFGCVMYEMLTGESPFMRENFTQTIMAHINEEAVPIEQMVPQAVIPAKLNDIVHKCIRKNVNERYPSMADVVEALGAVVRRDKEHKATMLPSSTAAGERISGPSQADINFELGVSFEEKGDDQQALVYYQRAADRGHLKAQFLVGRAFFWGYGTERHVGEAAHWYRKAAQQGLVNAMLELFNCLMMFGEPDAYKEAHHWLTEAVSGGFAPAQHELARCYHFGVFDSVNLPEALNWYSKAAEQKYAPALVAMGTFYEQGQVVGQDLATAAQLFRAAADQDYSPAAYKLALCCLLGRGVNQSDSSGVKWLDKAASGGYPPALLKMEGMYRYGIILEKDIERADAFRNSALARADGDDLFDYGMQIANQGHREDAKVFVRAAAERGHQEAAAMINQ